MLELAEKARLDAKRSEDYQAKLERNRESNSSSNSSSNSQSSSVNSNPVNSVTLNKNNAAQLGFGWDDKTGKSFSNAFTEAMGNVYKIAENNRNIGMAESDVQAKFDRMVASLEAKYPQPVVPQSALDAVANLSRQQNYNVPTNNAATKKIELDLTYNGNRVSTEMPADQEGLLMSLVQALQDSKAIAGK